MKFMELQSKSSAIKGYTLVEVLVVVAIMGILSSMGVVGLQGAVQNNRIKDAGINVTAFMERTANEANRRSSKLCVKIEGDQLIRTYKGACPDAGGTLGEQVDEMSLEAPAKFVTSGMSDDGGCDVKYGTNTPATFAPRLGLSAVPTGCIFVQYGSTDKFAVAIKTATKNAVFYRLSYDNGASWSEF